MNDFAELSINIKGVGTYGTGIMYQYSEQIGYIITAKHCVYDEDKNEYYSELTYTDYNKKNLEEIGKPLISKEFDLAIIKVNIQTSYPKLYTIDPKNNDEIVLFGYPEYKSESREGIPIRGKVTQVQENNIIKLVMNNELSSYLSDEHANTRGFSGSGVYKEIEDKCYLIGLVTSLDSSGIHGIIKGHHIEIIKKYLIKETGIELIPFDLLNFNGYLNTLTNRLKKIEGEKSNISEVISNYYKENFENITPKDIFSSLNGNLVCPNQPHFDYSNSTMWIGWLELLLCKCFQNDFNFDINDFLKLLNQEKERSGIHMLYTDVSLLDNFVGELIRSELYDKIYENDVVFFNSQNRFYCDFLAKKEHLKGLVINIDDSQVDERFNIDNPNQQKLFPIVHLQYIEEKIIKFIKRSKHTTQREFIKDFRKELSEIFLEIEK